MLYTQMFLYLQVLDFFTTLIGFKLGLAEASPLSVRSCSSGRWWRFCCRKRRRWCWPALHLACKSSTLIRWITYWYAGLIAWNLCTILAGAHCR